VDFRGAIVHVWARRVERSALFVDEQDYQRYGALLAATVEECGWILMSFCLMPNHIHLLVELREPTLAKGMHWMHMKYVRWFNDRHERQGKLFEHRYKRKLVADDLYFLTLVDYIEMNPVHGNLCARPEDWQWSSRGISSGARSPSWLATTALMGRLDAMVARRRV
jgi:REP element-mobilizing transposase RayT